MNFDSPAQMVSSDDLNIREAATKAPQWKHRGYVPAQDFFGLKLEKAP